MSHANEPESLTEIDGAELYGRRPTLHGRAELVAAANRRAVSGDAVAFDRRARLQQDPLRLGRCLGPAPTARTAGGVSAGKRTAAPGLPGATIAEPAIFCIHMTRCGALATQHGGDAGRIRAADARQYIERWGPGSRADGHATGGADRRNRQGTARSPNDLLNELDVGDFEIPEIPSALPDDVMRQLPTVVESHSIALLRHMRRPMQREVSPPRRLPKPLVIITSNVDASFPDAFRAAARSFTSSSPRASAWTQILRDHLRDTLSRLQRDVGTGGSATGNELRVIAQRFLRTPSRARREMGMRPRTCNDRPGG